MLGTNCSLLEHVAILLYDTVCNIIIILEKQLSTAIWVAVKFGIQFHCKINIVHGKNKYNLPIRDQDIN